MLYLLNVLSKNYNVETLVDDVMVEFERKRKELNLPVSGCVRTLGTNEPDHEEFLFEGKGLVIKLKTLDKKYSVEIETCKYFVVFNEKKYNLDYVREILFRTVSGRT